MFSKREVKPIRPWHVAALVVIGAAAIFSRWYYFRWPTARVFLGGESFTVLVADNYNHLVQGWSDRKDMGGYGGMLFIFPDRGQHIMVMRRMYFPLDIVWLDGTTIVSLVENLTPDNRPEDQLTRYGTGVFSTAVVELPAGFIQGHRVRVGDTVMASK